jgi:hypothetical protein
MLYTSHAYNDFLYLNHFTKDSASDNPDRFLLTIPVPDDTILPGFALEQTGEFVLAALKSPKKYVGKSNYCLLSPAKLMIRTGYPCLWIHAYIT